MTETLTTVPEGKFDRHRARREIFEDRLMILHDFLWDHGTVLDFEVLELAGIDAQSGVALFQLDGASSSPCPTERIVDAELFLHGSVKWDGCSNWQFQDGDCMLHFCGFQHATSIGRLMARMYEIAQAEMASFDSHLADMPATISGVSSPVLALSA